MGWPQVCIQDCEPRLRTWLPPSRERSRLATFQYSVVMQAACSEVQRNRFANVCKEPFCLFYVVDGNGRDPQNNLSLARLKVRRVCAPRRLLGAGLRRREQA